MFVVRRGAAVGSLGIFRRVVLAHSLFLAIIHRLPTPFRLNYFDKYYMSVNINIKTLIVGFLE